MYMKVFPHGKGTGSAPVNYLVRTDYTGRDAKPPDLLRGDPEMTKQLIDSQDRVWKFTAGVLSNAPGDEITPEKEKELMDSFESVAFAGLEPDQYDILWVRHTHAGHHELHFVIPRMELHEGKAYNPCPPGWQKDFDVFRDLYNWREGWKRPDDPERARAYKPIHTDLARARDIRRGVISPDAPVEDPRKLIHEYIAQRIENGIVTNRTELVLSLHEAGLETPRIGKNYLTVLDPASGNRFRMKGGVYCEHWRLEEQAPSQDQRGARDAGADREERVRELAAQLERVIEKRTGYNRKRYHQPGRERDRNRVEPSPTPGATNREAAKGHDSELAEVSGTGRMPDDRYGAWSMGPQRGNQQLHGKSMESDNRAATPEGEPGKDNLSAGAGYLGSSITRDERGAIHRVAKERDWKERLDHWRPQSHQAGAMNHEHDRTGATLAGGAGEDANGIFSATIRAGRGFSANLGDSSRTSVPNRTSQQLLRKLGAVVNALERYFGERDAEREIARVLLKLGKDMGGLEM